jgi:hypothetical protein
VSYKLTYGIATKLHKILVFFSIGLVTTGSLRFSLVASKRLQTPVQPSKLIKLTNLEDKTLLGLLSMTSNPLNFDQSTHLSVALS